MINTYLAVITANIEPVWIGVIAVVVVIVLVLISKYEPPATRKELNDVATAIRKEMSERQANCHHVKALENDIKDIKKDSDKKYDDLRAEMRGGFENLQKLLIENLKGK